MLLSNKKEWPIDTCNNLGGPQGHCAGCQKANAKSHILHESIQVTFLKCQNYKNGNRVVDCTSMSGSRLGGCVSYLRGNQWEKLGEGYTAPLCAIFTIFCEIYNYFEIKYFIENSPRHLCLIFLYLSVHFTFPWTGFLFLVLGANAAESLSFPLFFIY